jgi:REP element-mobilizing transposase RayT
MNVLISIPPKYSVAQVVGFIKGKSAIHITWTFMGRRQNYTGHHFWARGTTSQRSIGMRRRSGSASARKKRKIDD